MFTLRPTKMLARRLKIAVPATPPPVRNRVADWCVHEFRAGGYRYLIFCNTASLYPLVTHARGVNDEGSLIERCVEAMRLNFVARSSSFNSNAGSCRNSPRSSGRRFPIAQCSAASTS